MAVAVVAVATTTPVTPLPPPPPPPPVYTIVYRIEDPNGNLLLDLNDRVIVETLSLDIASPDIRTNVTDRPDSDGTLDASVFHGARAVTWVGLMLNPDPTIYDAFQDTLRGLCHARLRNYLHIEHPGWAAPRRVLIRGSQLSAPWSSGRQITVGWVAPDGVLEAETLNSATIFPTGGAPTGRTYPKVYPWSYGTGDATTAITVSSGGTTATPLTATISGPCVAPQLAFPTDGRLLSFPEVTLAAGHTLVVDTFGTTAYLDGVPTNTVYPDPTVSDWPQLWPGPNLVELTASSIGASCSCDLTWRDRWL